MSDLPSLTARIEALAAQALTKATADKARNRLLMPQTALIVDEFIAIFGKLPAGRITEAGRTVQWGRLPEWCEPGYQTDVRAFIGLMRK